jgi:succinate-semialdehyde dehydrogenase/glutarate-semialdehyde dehydrogenase
MYISINPATEEIIAKYELCSEKELEVILNKSQVAFSSWRKVPLQEKLKVVSKLSSLLDRDEKKIGRIISNEMGRVIKMANFEVTKQKLFCEHALSRAEIILKGAKVPNPGVDATMILEPLGIIFAITPWNFPFATSIRLALPALLTGNTVILKPAPNVTGSVLALRDILLEAGFPEDVLQVACLDNSSAEKLIGHPLIKKVAFVGSDVVGAKLASICGTYSKPILLELGGSDPFIVLDDADIELAARDAAGARCGNAGQICCSSKRFIIEESVYDIFVNSFINHIKNIKVGDPLSDSTDMGPLARKDIRDKLSSQVDLAITNGAKVLLDGGELPGKGFFFSPMVLEETKDIGTATDEEFFGPVASVFKAKSPEHAIQIANLSRFGLGSAIYSQDLNKALELASDLENGFVYINKPPGLNPYLPFGGVKGSGYGRDCGDEGYYEYVNKKIVVK